MTWSSRSAPSVAGFAQAPDAQRGVQGGGDAVAHGVGDRQVELVAGKAEVERVAGDRRRRLEPAGEREGPGLAGLGPGEEPVLDLRGQAQRPGALTPLVEVGMAAVGDHHEGEQVRELRDRGDRLRVRLARQVQLQEPDGLTALGDRSEHTPVPGPLRSPVLVLGSQDLHLLDADRLLLRPAVEGHHGRGLLAVAPLARRPRRSAARLGPQRDVGEPHECTPGQIGDQEGHLRRLESPAQLAGRRLHGLHRRGRLGRLDHAPQSPRAADVHHVSEHRARAGVCGRDGPSQGTASRPGRATSGTAAESEERNPG